MDGVDCDHPPLPQYDLKGSWYKREVGAVKRATNPNAILKDCDLDMRLLLDDDTYAQLDAALQADCAMLRSLAVVDYSLLLGVHYVAWGNGYWQPPEVWCTVEYAGCWWVQHTHSVHIAKQHNPF